MAPYKEIINWIVTSFEISGYNLNPKAVQAFSYNESQEVENIYGAGAYPVGQGKGNVTYEASITMLLEEVHEWKRQVNNKFGSTKLIDAEPFTMKVIYKTNKNAQRMVATLTGCVVTSAPINGSQNDKSYPVEITLLPTDVNEEPL